MEFPIEKATLLLPSYLQSLDYATYPQIRELSDRAITVTDGAILVDQIWFPWRGIFEYVACVEYAREMIKKLPTGNAIGSNAIVPAQYHSASLVFFAQATLDNTALWTIKHLNLKVTGSNCAFHKTKFINELTKCCPTAAASMAQHVTFIEKLEKYRQFWIHRISGGARIFSNKSPSEPDAKIEIGVPINHSIGQFELDPKAYIDTVAQTQTENGGEWLYPVTVFSDEITNGLRDFLLAFLTEALADSNFSAK